MARKAVQFVLLLALFISLSHEQDFAAYTNNLQQMIRQTTQQLSDEIQRHVHNVVQSTLANVRNLTAYDTSGVYVGQNSWTISNGFDNARNFQSIRTRYTSKGEPYVHYIDEYTVDGIIYHNETLYYPQSDITKKNCWTLDSSVPDAPYLNTTGQC